jgi:hypothetical protein
LPYIHVVQQDLPFILDKIFCKSLSRMGVFPPLAAPVLPAVDDVVPPVVPEDPDVVVTGVASWEGSAAAVTGRCC